MNTVKRVLKLIESHPSRKYKCGDIASAFDMSSESACMYLGDLYKRRMIKREKNDSGQYEYHSLITPEFETTIAGPKYMPDFKPLKGYEAALLEKLRR